MRLESALLCTAGFCPEQFATFSRHLDPAWIDEALLSTGVATVRRRRLPLEQVTWLVGMGLMRDKPIAELADRLELVLPAKGEDRSVVPSAVIKARARLGAEPMEWLFVRSASQWGLESAQRYRWRGLLVLDADGTTLRAADSDENRRHFGGQSAGEHGRGRSGYPLIRVAALMALRSHILIAASFGPYAVDERTYAADLWPFVPDRSIVLLDRNYLQANVMVGLTRCGQDRHWLMRAKSTSKWRVLEKLGPADELVEMAVSQVARAKDPTLPEKMTVRAIRYQRRGYQPQVLLTSLIDAARFPADEIRDLYHERWELELGYDEIETEMLQREESIRSRTVAGAKQEVWGVLLAYNLVRLEMERVAAERKIAPVRISFIAALRFVVDQWDWAVTTRTPGAIPKRLQLMRSKLGRLVLPPRRSERVYPRAVKVKMSNYALKRRTPPRAPGR